MNRRRWLLGLVVLGLAVGAVGVLAQPANFDLSAARVSSGRSESSGGGYLVDGTLGQPDAGALTGGAYTLAGGFEVELTEPITISHTYLPLINQ